MASNEGELDLDPRRITRIFAVEKRVLGEEPWGGPPSPFSRRETINPVEARTEWRETYEDIERTGGVLCLDVENCRVYQMRAADGRQQFVAAYIIVMPVDPIVSD